MYFLKETNLQKVSKQTTRIYSRLSDSSYESRPFIESRQSNNSLSTDDGYSSCSSWSKESRNIYTPASYSRYGFAVKSSISPSISSHKYTRYCYSALPSIRDTGIQMEISKFANLMFPQPYMRSLQKFDERVSKIYDALGKNILDIREQVIKATLLDTSTVTQSCRTWPSILDGSDLCDTPEEGSSTGEVGLNWMMLQNKTPFMGPLSIINEVRYI